MTKSQDKNLNILGTNFIIIFKELSFAKNCPRSESTPRSIVIIVLSALRRTVYFASQCDDRGMIFIQILASYKSYTE